MEIQFTFWIENDIDLKPFKTAPVLFTADECSNQSFLSDVYQPKMDSSSSSSQHASEAVSPLPHTTTLRTAEDAQPPMLGQESVDGTVSLAYYTIALHSAPM